MGYIINYDQKLNRMPRMGDGPRTGLKWIYIPINSAIHKEGFQFIYYLVTVSTLWGWLRSPAHVDRWLIPFF